jgi:hypothetical protein
MRVDLDKVRWLGEAHDEGELALRVGEIDDVLVAEWPGRARFVVRRDGRDGELVGLEGSEPRDVEKLRRGAARLLLHHLEGNIGLHGASVVLDGRAAVFIGKSGQGKSTIAATLCERSQASLSSDDAVALERHGGTWLVKPLESEHWLDADARRAALGIDRPSVDKEPVDARRIAMEDTPLAFVAELAFADVPAPRFVVHEGLAAIAAVLPLIVRFVLDDPDLQKRELDLLHHLVAAVPIVRLERPRDLRYLDATNALVASALRTGAFR